MLLFPAVTAGVPGRGLDRVRHHPEPFIRWYWGRLSSWIAVVSRLEGYFKLVMTARRLVYWIWGRAPQAGPSAELAEVSPNEGVALTRTTYCFSFDKAVSREKYEQFKGG
jgi:hypothetical protein